MNFHLDSVFSSLRFSSTILLFVSTFSVGCIPSPKWEEAEIQKSVTAPTKLQVGTNSVQGKVVWKGAIPPNPESFFYRAAATNTNGQDKKLPIPNPLFIRIDANKRWVEGLLVRLIPQDPTITLNQAESSIEVVADARQIQLKQNGRTCSTGWVRKGQSVRFSKSADDYVEIIRGTGVSLFGIPFRNSPALTTRTLQNPGLIELSSGVNHYWSRAFLWVLDREVAGQTDQEGKFEMNQLPDGKFMLELWVPNWNKDTIEYDPETSVAARMKYQKAFSIQKEVTLTKSLKAEVDFELDMSLFGALVQ
jgi:hypothetical protein